MKLSISSATIAAVSIGATSCGAFAPVISHVKTIRDAQKSSFIDTPLFMSDQDNWQAPKSAMIGGAGVNNAGEPPFEIRGFSLGNLVIGGGFLVTVLSFAEYLSNSGGDGLNVSGLGFVYGIPITLAGAALKYAEIDPVPCISSPGAEQVFEKKATEIIKKIKQDVTRHRYGDEAHLDTTVKKLGLVVPGKAYPQLMELREDIDAEQRLVGIRLTTGGPLSEEYLASKQSKEEAVAAA
eukprot:scaffold248377_cov74-Cyclotella_meneghiniana.AAC.3